MFGATIWQFLRYTLNATHENTRLAVYPMLFCR